MICEGVATNGRFGLSIEGKCYKESEQPGPEGPEPMENYSPTISLNYIQTITPMVSNDTISNFSYLSKAVQIYTTLIIWGDLYRKYRINFHLKNKI